MPSSAAMRAIVARTRSVASFDIACTSMSRASLRPTSSLSSDELESSRISFMRSWTSSMRSTWSRPSSAASIESRPPSGPVILNLTIPIHVLRRFQGMRLAQGTGMPDEPRATVDRARDLWDKSRALQGARLPTPVKNHLRLVLMLASLILIVFSAYLLRMKLSEDSADALRSVAHTHRVTSELHALSATLNEMEARAFAIAAASDDTARERYDALKQAWPRQLADLRDLTRDNPDQQVRLATLAERLEHRVAAFDRAVDTGAASAGQLVEASADHSFEAVQADMLARESELVRQREAHARDSLWLARWATLAATLVQVLLIGTMIWVSERHISRRIAAESTARDAVGRARMIVETVREPIAVVGADLALVHVNRAFMDFYGLGDTTPARLSDLPAWTDAALLQRLRDVARSRRELWDMETIQQVVADDGPRHLVINARPMLTAEGEVSETLLTVSDITARKRSEEQVLRLNRQLAGKVAQVTDSNRELEAFSYSVSHDLRAPLRHIAGFARKLRTKVEPFADETVLHYCDVIDDAARRMSALIEDLLSYSRLGRHAMRPQMVDMQSLVEQVQGTLMSANEDRRIDWRIAPLPVVIADASLIQLVWQNLLDNAIKYTAATERARIEVRAEEDADGWVFHVADNGVGFDMNHAAKLYGVFQRLHKASEFPGSGIGLASVRRIIARHGGRTWAEATPGQGATFHFSLPRHEPAD
ncbi:MAG: PAS domain S-box protein [Lysobacteraceae bacterium]|nr:MAG: PAS domain S-box protein [Xanthomonadaceae bacterium]